MRRAVISCSTLLLAGVPLAAQDPAGGRPHAACNCPPEVLATIAEHPFAEGPKALAEGHWEDLERRLTVMLARHSNDVHLHRHYQNFFIGTDQLDVVTERYAAWATQHPDDPTYLYLYGRLLAVANRAEARVPLERALELDPDYAWAHFALVHVLESIVDDPDEAEAHLAAFLDLCPSSPEIRDRLRSVGAMGPELARKAAAHVRAVLATRSNPELADLPVLVWDNEFRVLPVAEHATVREHIAADLTRLRELDRRGDERWLDALLKGYRMVGDEAGIAWVTQCFLDSHRDSQTTKRLVVERWRALHPWPGPRATTAETEAFYREALRATDHWIELWPEEASMWHERFNALSHLPDSPSTALVEAADRVLALLAQNRTFWSHPPVPVLIARSFVERGVDLDRVPALVELGQKEIDEDEAKGLAASGTDPSRAREIGRNAEWERWQGREILCDALVALGRLEKTRTVLDEMEQQLERLEPPADASSAERRAHEQLRASWYRRRADHARATGRPADALLLLQTALAHDPGSAELSQRAAAQSRELGGSTELWEEWLAASSAGATTTATGRTSELEEHEPRSLPAFSLSDLDGRTWRLDDLKGRVAFVNVWTTWCGPCLAELPEVQRLYERVKDRPDIVVLTLNADENPGLVAPLVASKGYTFPVLLAGQYVESVLDRPSFPRNWIVDRDGLLRREELGFRVDEPAWGDEVLGLMERLIPPATAAPADPGLPSPTR